MAGKTRNNPAEDDDGSSYQNSAQYHELMKKRMEAKQQAAADGDEDIKPISLDELDETDWGRAPQRKSTNRPPRLAESQQMQSAGAFDVEPVTKRHTQDHRAGSSARMPAAPSPTPNANQTTAQTRSVPTSELVPGTIFRFDDGSIAIFKDAVSGKDYALLYFLEPDGRLMPRGVFFEQYDRIEIGRLPLDEFETAIKIGKWDYDLIVFHLSSYQYAKYLRTLLGRTPHYDSFAHDNAPRKTRQQPTSPKEAHGPSYEEPPAWDAEERRVPPVRPSEPVVQAEPEIPAEPEDPMQRGRIIRIDIGGRAWEAIYLLTDAIGPVLAHDTNNEWQLMHLDLSRFQDSLEFGPMVSPAELEVLEKHLADNGLIQ